MKFESLGFNPDKNRLLAALKGKEWDKVPFFDNYIDSVLVEKILGYNAGNTCAAVGEPYRGDARSLVGGDMCIPMAPKDYIKLSNIICQDSIMVEAAYAPYRRLNKDGLPEIINDGSIKNRNDWKEVLPPTKADIENRIGYLKIYKETLKDTNIALTLQTGNFFLTHYHNLCGSDFFTLIYDDPLLVEEMLTTATQYFIDLTKKALEVGFDIFFSGDDVAFKTGLMINPRHFKKIYMPYAEKIYGPVLNAGIPVIFDCDGNPEEIIDMIIQLGCSCLFPIDSNGMDWRQTKKKYGKKLCLFGAIDVDPLIRLSVDDVEKYVKEIVENMKIGGGYIAGTVSSVNEIPFENYITMVNTIHKYGLYKR